MISETIQIPPFSINIDGVEVNILEVLSTQLISGDKWYHVVVQIKYKNILSKKYTLDVKDMNNLINKLKIEISKIKYIEIAYGLNYLKQIIT
ncbi:MAG: hypothetical protein OH338_05535 [Candidatus Parvarchaeota archaeon]|nr:hypothetical protein [Candidatus Parvarchaeum tengchongense]